MNKREDAMIIGLMGLCHATSHFYQLVLAPLFPMMKETFGVSYAALGLMLTVFYIFSALPQPVAGFVVDRYGGRSVLIGGLALQVLGIVLIAVAPTYALLVLGAALAGLGNSVYHPADFAILNAKVAESRLGHAFATHGITGALGFAVAPLFSGTMAAAFGWRATVLVAAGVGVAVLLLLLANVRRIGSPSAHHESKRAPMDISVLLAPAVLLCFAYFAIYAAGLAGLQGFTVSALTLQFGVGTTFAAIALTAYMVGGACGNLAGGFLATRTRRHDLVAAAGLSGSAASILLVALGAVPAAALPFAFAFAGFSVGATAPSRDLIVRASTPPGATGRVYGFVYSGLDVGSLAVPVFYGWLVDHQLFSAVFYTVSGATAIAVLTVLTLPRRRASPVPA
jgi:MFS transporter, FSR family, fosmidomycin resistance protein